MSELRYRYPGDANAPGPSAPQAGDLAPRRDGPDARRPAGDAAPARDKPGRYDADAQFKRPVPKPEGYLPGDTMGSAAALAAVRRITGSWRGSRNGLDGGADLAPRRDPAAAPRLREAADGDRSDTLGAVVDRPDFRHPDGGPRGHGTGISCAPTIGRAA